MSTSQSTGNIPGDVFESGSVYTLETVEKITHISRDRIVLYSEYGLVTPVATSDPAGLVFDDEAIHQLRRIAYLLAEYDINSDGLRMFSALLNEVERLRREVRFLRERGA